MLGKLVITCIALFLLFLLLYNLYDYFVKKGGGKGNWMTALSRNMIAQDDKSAAEGKAKMEAKAKEEKKTKKTKR